MKAQRRIVFGILLTALLALCFGALADSPLGVQTGARYGDIRLTASTDAATVLDWLEDYLQTEVTPNIILAEDLVDYSDMIEQNRAMLNSANDDQMAKWLRDYDAVPNGGALTARELAVRSRRELQETVNEMQFYADKLTEYITQDEYLRRKITSGACTPEEIDRMKDELAIADQAAEKYRSAALKRLIGNDALTETASLARTRLSLFDSSNPYRAAVASIQGLGAYIEQRQINALINRENGVDVPHITVISDKQVCIWIKDPERTGTLGVPLGVQGIAVTLQAEVRPGVYDPQRKQTVVTDEDGLAIFEVANFNPDEERNINVRLTFEDAKEREDTSVIYQRKDLGLVSLHAGDNPLDIFATVDDGRPYLVSLLFEDLDMTVMNEAMCVSGNNTTQYLVSGKVEMNGTSDRVRVSLVDIGSEAFGDTPSGTVLYETTLYPGSNGAFSVKAAWLNKNAAPDAIAIREGHQIAVRLDIGASAANDMPDWLFPNLHGFSSEDWVDNFRTFGAKPSSSGTYMDAFVGNFGLKIPSGVPIIGGSEIAIDNILKMLDVYDTAPPVKVHIEVPNQIIILVNIQRTNPDEDGSGRVYASESKRESEKRIKADHKDALEKKSLWQQGLDDAKKVMQSGNYARSWGYGFSYFLQLMGRGEEVPYDPDEPDDELKFTGDVTFGIDMTANGDWTAYMYPAVYANLSLVFRFKIGIDFGMDFFTTMGGALNRCAWSDAAGFTVNFHIELIGTAAVGIKGLLGFGIRGAAWIDFTYHTTFLHYDTSFKIGARLDIFVDALFFHWSTEVIGISTEFAHRSEDDIRTPPPSSYTPVKAAVRPAIEAGNVGTPVFENVVCRPEDMKLVQDDHSNLFCFWVDRSVKPNTLNVHYVDGWYDGAMDYPDRVIFTVPEEWDYLYDFDVCYDGYLNANSIYDHFMHPNTGFYFVVTMGNWEGGIDLRKDKSISAEAGYRQYISELCAHADGATYFGWLKDNGPGFDVRSHQLVETYKYTAYNGNALYMPQIQAIANAPEHEFVKDYDSRLYTFVIGGFTPYIDNDAGGLAKYRLLQINMDTVRYAPQAQPWISPDEVNVILEGQLVGRVSNETVNAEMDEEYFPEYWLLSDPNYSAGVGKYEGEIYSRNIMLIHRTYLSGKNTLQYVGRNGVKTVSLPRGLQTITQISDPIRIRETISPYGTVMDQRYYHFLVSFTEEAEPGDVEETQNAVRSRRAILTFQSDGYKQIGRGNPGSTYVDPYNAYDIGYYFDVYDLPASNGTADALFIPDQAAFYFYWFANRPSIEDPDVSVVDIMACQYDSGRRAISPNFTMATLPETECLARKFVCLRDSNGKTIKLIGIYHDENGLLKKQSIQLKTSPSILAFAPDVLAVGEGHSFGLLARIENTGAIVLQKITYVLTAENVDTGESSVWQMATIDLRRPQNNSVKHYDYLQQDHPELKGKSLKELEAALSMMNDDQYVSTGEHTVYRMPDSNDWLNGNIQHMTTYSMEDGQPATASQTNSTYFFMPGNIATYKTGAVAPEGVSGKFALRMGISTVNFCLGMDADAPVYQAALRDDGKGFEYFLLDENGERVRAANGEEDGVLALFAPGLPAKPVESATVADKTGLNTARNDALTYGHERYLTMEQNDYQLEARVYSVNGEQYVGFTMSNNAPEIAPNGTPRLIAKASYLGKETPTGWVTTLRKSNIKDGFNRGITVPLKDITNGAKYEELTVYLVTAESDDPLDFMDLNGYNNEVTLDTKSPLRILQQPQNITVEEGTDAVFTVVPEGADKCRYQWAIYRPDGTMAQLPGETGQTLTVRKAQRSQSGYSYCCLVSVPDGRTVRSDWAVLTVTAKVPKTGDAVNPFALAAVGLAAAAACAVLAFTLARKRKKA